MKLCEVFNQTKTANQSTLNFAPHTRTHAHTHRYERRQTIKQKQSGITQEAARGKPIKICCGLTRGMRNVTGHKTFLVCAAFSEQRTANESLLKFREKSFNLAPGHRQHPRPHPHGRMGVAVESCFAQRFVENLPHTTLLK